jgi:hypothetical protein
MLIVVGLLVTLAPPVYALDQVTHKLSHPLTSVHRVLDFRVSPDGTWVAYRVARSLPPLQDNPPPPPADLFTVPAGGGAAVPINPPANVPGESVESYQFSPDGSQITYLRTTTDTVLGNIFELFTRPVDGSAPPLSVSGPIPVGAQPVRDFVLDFADVVILPPFGDGSVRAINFRLRHRSVPERISSINDGTSNTFFLGEQTNNLRQLPIGGDGSVRQINPDLTDGGVVYDFLITPDGTLALYRADQNIDGTIELFGVPADGSSAGFRISGPMVVGGDVHRFKVSADSGRAVYLADQTTNGVDELYSTPANGGIVTKLNAALVLGGNVTQFDLTADGSQVVYLADQNTDGLFELFSVPTNRSTAPAPIGSAVNGRSVRSFVISPDNTRVFYVAQETSGVLGLFVGLVGSNVTPLNPIGPRVADLATPAVQVSGDGTRVIYLADAEGDGVLEVASINLAVSPSGVIPQLNQPPAAGGNIAAFKLSQDGQRVVYAVRNAAGVIELFSVSVDGGPVDRVNGPLVAGGSALAGPLDFQFSPDSRTVFYLADQEVDGRTELFAAFDPPTLAFAQPGYIFVENQPASRHFAVQRSGQVAAPGSVRVAFTGAPTGGTAKGGASLGGPGSGVDFVHIIRDVPFGAGQISATVAISVNHDLVAEPAETFAMQLLEPVAGVTGTQDSAQGVILDTSQSPLLTARTFSLPENSSADTPIQPAQAGAELGAAAVTTYTILSGNTNNAFRIDNTGALFVNNAAALDYETTPTFVLLVEARDDLGSSSAATWTLHLQDQNEPPLFGAQTRSIAENSPVGAAVGAKLVAGDPDGDALTFSLASPVFSITSGGQLLVKDNSRLDFETAKQFSLNVTASDGKGGSRTAPITVNVLDAAESDPDAPLLVTLSPASAVAGGSDFKLQVTGKNLTATSVVRWNGAVRKTAFSGGALIALIGAADIKAATTAKVDVIDTATKKLSNALSFPVALGKVGIAVLSVEPAGVPQSAVGQLTVFTLRWTHTTQPWRAMNEMDLRLAAGEQVGLWVRYQEARDPDGNDASRLILLNADGSPAGSGRFGEAKVLENDLVRLDLSQARFEPSTQEDSQVSVRLPVTFKPGAVALEAYTVALYGTDDAGAEQGPNLIGSWQVTAPTLYLPQLVQ